MAYELTGSIDSFLSKHINKIWIVSCFVKNALYPHGNRNECLWRRMLRSNRLQLFFRDVSIGFNRKTAKKHTSCSLFFLHCLVLQNWLVYTRDKVPTILTNYANNSSTNDCQVIIYLDMIELGTVVVSLFFWTAPDSASLSSSSTNYYFLASKAAMISVFRLLACILLSYRSLKPAMLIKEILPFVTQYSMLFIHFFSFFQQVPMTH